MSIRSEKLITLQNMDLGTREQEARDTLMELWHASDEFAMAKIKSDEAQERVEEIETGLTLSEAYLTGKNAEVRAAWLKSQRAENTELAMAMDWLRAKRTDVMGIESRRDHLSRRYQLAISMIRLAAAQLHFLAED